MPSQCCQVLNVLVWAYFWGDGCEAREPVCVVDPSGSCCIWEETGGWEKLHKVARKWEWRTLKGLSLKENIWLQTKLHGMLEKQWKVIPMPQPQFWVEFELHGEPEKPESCVWCGSWLCWSACGQFMSDVIVERCKMLQHWAWDRDGEITEPRDGSKADRGHCELSNTVEGVAKLNKTTAEVILLVLLGCHPAGRGTPHMFCRGTRICCLQWGSGKQGAGSWANPGDELSSSLNAAGSQKLEQPAASLSAATSALGVLILSICRQFGFWSLADSWSSFFWLGVACQWDSKGHQGVLSSWGGDIRSKTLQGKLRGYGHTLGNKCCLLLSKRQAASLPFTTSQRSPRTQPDYAEHQAANKIKIRLTRFHQGRV